MDLPKPNMEQIIEAFDSNELIFFSSLEVPIYFQSKILLIEENYCKIFNSIPFQIIHKVTESSSFSLQIGNQRYLSNSIGSDGVNIIFPISKSTAINNSRRSKRLSFIENDQAYCTFINPFDRQTKIKKRLLDISEAGMSIRVYHKTQLFKVGSIFENLKITALNINNTISKAKIVYIRNIIDLKRMQLFQVGFKFL